MFAKAVVSFFALVAFVNAAPIIDYTTNPGVRPLHPIKIALPRGGDNIQPVGSDGDYTSDFNQDYSSGDNFSNDVAISKRGSFVELDFDFDADVDLALPGLKREEVDLDTLGSRILNGLKSHRLDEYTEHFSTRIQRLKDLLSSDVSRTQIAAEANNLLLEYRQVLAGLDVNKPVKARGVVLDTQVLSQLQNFVANTANLLRALGKPDAVNAFLSEVNNLKNEAQNGNLDAGDLLSAARDVINSIL